MKRNNLWRWLFVLFISIWAIFEMIPPNDRDLITEFENMAVNKDDTFNKIVTITREKQKAQLGTEYADLLAAADNIQLTNYFPTFKPGIDVNANAYVLNKVQRQAAGKIRLGIDLKGGTSFLLGMNTDALKSTAANSTNAVVDTFQREAALSQAVEVLRRRIDSLGVAEPVIQPVGEDRIQIQLPGLSASEMASARQNIQKAAFLEFRFVHPESSSLLQQGLIVPGYERLIETRVDKTGNKSSSALLVERKRAAGTVDGKRVELSGKQITKAYMSRDQFTGRPEIIFEFDSEGADLFAQITKVNVGRLMAIVLDGHLQSAPVINGVIPGGRGSISGSFTTKEAMDLANALENPLQAPLQILAETSVDPTLGAETITSGMRAALLGLALVIVFMVVYYMVGGMIANLAVLLNLVILMGVLCSIQATLTLPGIAGIVLTIGMAVDANVLIFERIREELKAGKSLRGSINAGYDKAFGTIFDANITTLIASVILIFMGTGSIKGFGVTLTIGLLASMFTALVFTRLILDWLLEKNILKSLKMLSFVGDTKINFLKLAKPAFIASWLVILFGMGYGVFVRGENALNHEFKGGVEINFDFTTANKVDQDKISASVKNVLGVEPTVQYQTDLTSGHELLAIKTALISDKDIKEGNRVESTVNLLVKTLGDDFPSAAFKMISSSSTGPSIGSEIQRSAIISIVMALFFIMIYVALRYEFSFALGAVMATLHDVLIMVGVYLLAGKQISAPMVAALLTIVGFSINDTIVIFDRIREDLKLGVRGSFKDLMNQALNETLSRTLITSGTTLLSALALFVFGGSGLSDFSFSLLIGIIAGTYSSIYIACAIVLWWNKGERPTIAQPQTNVIGADAQSAGA